MLTIQEFIAQVPQIANLSHSQRIKLFVWYLQVIRGQDSVRVADIRSCCETAHLDMPSNLARSIEALTEKKPPDLLKKNGVYRLHASQRQALDALYSKPESMVVVEQALDQLPGKLWDDSERLYLEETLTCYRHHAFRAAIVMVWNLAFDHLLNWILADSHRLVQFNRGIPKRNPKKGHISVISRLDFEELKEGEVIDIASDLPGVTSNMKRTLKEKLGRRNTYAHPSTMTVARSQVDDMITDLVQNIILKLDDSASQQADSPAAAPQDA